MNAIEIKSLPKGLILDVGGGGEGIIAQIGRERVTAVDKLQSEIDEAKDKAPEANWVLADARKLDFSDSYFDNATAFFSLMYMSNEVKEEVFQEVYRVLSARGDFLIWDIPMLKDKGVSLIKVKVICPNRNEIRTAYGVSSKKQTINSIEEKLQKIGFDIEILENNKDWFLLKARK